MSGCLHLVSERTKVDGEGLETVQSDGFDHVLKWRQEDSGGSGLMMGDGRSFVTERRNLATGLVMGAEIL